MTIKELYEDTLKKAQLLGIEKSTIDILFEEVNGFNNVVELNLNLHNEMKEEGRFYKLLNGLFNGQPIQYLINKGYFYGYEYYVDNRVLIPRPETEELVEKVLTCIDNYSHPTVIDICSGSGCIGLTLKQQHNDMNLYLSDLSLDALQVIKVNQNRFNVKCDIVSSDLLEYFISNNIKCDILTCNPPYISKDEEIDDIVKNNEPLMALIPPSGDGLELYIKIFKQLPLVLNKQGRAFFEIGCSQKEKLIGIIQKMLPLVEYNFYEDIEKKDRILEILMR